MKDCPPLNLFSVSTRQHLKYREWKVSCYDQPMLNLPPAVHTGVKPKIFKPYVLLTDNPKLHVPGQKQSPSTKKTVSKWRVDS